MALEVRKQDRENFQSLIRRFTRRIQQSGILLQARKMRFKKRALSRAKRKTKALRRMEAQKERAKMKKLGKSFKLR